MMDNDYFSFPIDMAGRSSVAMDGIVSETTSNSLVQNHFDSFDLNNQSQQTLAEYTMVSTLQGEPIHHLQTTQDIVMGSNSVLGRAVVRDASLSCSNPIADLRFQGQYVGGTPVSSTSLATLLAARSDHQDNLNGLALSGPWVHPSEAFRTFASSDYTDAFNNAAGSSMNYCSGEMYGNMNDRGGFNRFPAPLGPGVKSPTRVGFQPYLSAANLEPNSWVSSDVIDVGVTNPFESQNLSNALSLSLATCHPSTVNGSSISDQCSEISCSAAAYHCLKETRLGLDHTACNSKDLSLSFNSYRADQFSRVVSSSKYLQVMQEILAQIASYSLENLDFMSLSPGGSKTGANAPLASSYRMLQLGTDESPNVDGRFEVQVDPALQKRALEAKKSQLLSLLQVVDERYNQCLDEIHTVISAFHAATELDPQIHTRFALQTISFMYKSLRDRISNQILAMGAFPESGCTREAEGASETSYLQNQWTLQQLKKKDHQMWRPQRGLPERSVSVLRTWMFQNFLHPYPKDADKHLLAMQSGLTRSQVSNWFINARVRLWKPMIEEMYAEMNRRKARQDDQEGSNNSHNRSIVSICHPRFDGI